MRLVNNDKITSIQIKCVNQSGTVNWYASTRFQSHISIRILAQHGNQSELLREQYVQNVTAIQNDVRFEIRNASRAMWACDPNDFNNQGNPIIPHIINTF